jgi:peptidoglycan/LPS O-acetylase OafA/YrhL
LERRQFEALDGMRGLAALLVLNLHIEGGAFDKLIPHAYLAVDFFFALSGFVLAHAYEARLREGMGLAEFMARRYIRLWPLFAISMAIGLAVKLAETPPSRGALAVHVGLGLLFLPQALFQVLPFASKGPVWPVINAPAWSLTLELFANLIYGLIARFLNKWVLGAILGASAAAMVAIWLKFHTLDLDATYGVGEYPPAIARVMWSFFAGVAVYRFWRFRPAIQLPVALAGLALCLMLFFPPELAWVLLGFPVLIYFAASAEPRGAMGGLCRQLGAASYAVYVLHWPIIAGLQHFMPILPIDSPWTTVVIYSLVVPLALLLDRVYDRPARRWLEKRLLPRIRSRRWVGFGPRRATD